MTLPKDPEKRKEYLKKISETLKRKYASGELINAFAGHKHSEEVKRKMSLKQKGKIISEETKKKLSEALKKIPHTEGWNEKMRNALRGRKLSEETKRKIGLKSLGRKRPAYSFVKQRIKMKEWWDKNKNNEFVKNRNEKISKAKIGIPRSEEVKRRLSETRKRKYASGELVVSEEFKKRMRERMGLSNNPMWKGGKSFEPYTRDFNISIKNDARKRDNYVCQNCGVSEEELGRHMDIHHINYNKRDSSPENLICLCQKCHSKSNSNRKYWRKRYSRLTAKKYFNALINKFRRQDKNKQ